MKTKFFYGMTALATLGLAACSSEDLPVDNGNPGSSDGNESYYVSVAIHGDMGNGTRAGANNGNPEEGDTDFGNGTGQESVVKNAYFVFYNEKGDLIGNIVNVDLGEAVTNPTPTGTVESYYYQVVRVDTYKGQGKPKQVLCYINPVSPAALQTSLNEIQTVTRDNVTTGSGTNQLFPMSNSVYYASNDVNATSPNIAAQITDGQVFETEAAAQEAAKKGQAADAADTDKAKILNIYVERYAAKLTLNMATDAIEPYETSTKNDAGTDVGVDFTFVVDGWALNAEAKQIYAIKNFRVQGETGQILPDNYTWTKLNGRINPATPPVSVIDGAVVDPTAAPLDWTTQAWQWNNPSYHRSYWACSPAYFQDTYPEVASDITANSPQRYLSYWDVIGREANPDAGIAAVEKKGYTLAEGATAHYFRETTVGLPALASQNPAAAVASVILCGHYQIAVDGQTGTLENTTFYTYMRDANNKPYVYFDNNASGATDAAKIASTVTGTTSLYKRFLQQQTTLYKKTTVNGADVYTLLDIKNEDDLKTLVALTEVGEISADVKDAATGAGVTPMKLADRQRTLQIKSGVTIPAGVYVANGNGYQLLVSALDEDAEVAKGQITVLNANVALMNQVGYAVCYTAGAGFFNIPVKHYGWYRNGNTQKNVTETKEDGTTTTNPNTKNINWNIVRVGDFGIVRNHSYQLTINSITGLATGIGNKTTPIVPPADTKDYYMAYRVNILKWAIVPPQGVDL